MKVSVFFPYVENSAPGQRFRWEQWIPLLRKRGLDISVHCFSSREVDAAQRRGDMRSVLARSASRYPSWFARGLHLARSSDLCVVHRNAALAGPPILEAAIAHVARRPIVYDFDDAIWTAPKSDGYSLARKLLRADWRVAKISKWACCVSAGNGYLADFARQYCDDVQVWPTTISMARYTKRKAVSRKVPIIGWSGSHSTASFIEDLLPTLRVVHEQQPFELLIMGAEVDLQGLPGRCVPWNEDTEIEHLQEMDIGLMPLRDDEWAKGKCGLKAIQYMGVATPPVVSDVGVNASIIDHNVTGAVVRSADDWVEALLGLLREPKKRLAMGELARESVAKRFSAESLVPTIGDKLLQLGSVHA